MAAVRFLGADALAAVFNDARARGDLARGDAVAVQLGAADGVPGLDGVSSEAVVMGLRAFGGDETKQNYIGASMTV